MIMPNSRPSGWGSKPEWTVAAAAAAAVNTRGIIDAGQCSLWGNLIWSAIGQAILIPHHTRLSYKGTLFNIAGNVHILNTSRWRFPKPMSMAILRYNPHLCSIEPVSWSGHTCSSLCRRSLVVSFSFCDEPLGWASRNDRTGELIILRLNFLADLLEGNKQFLSK